MYLVEWAPMTSSSATAARTARRTLRICLGMPSRGAGVQCFFDEHSLEVGDVAADHMLKAMEEATYGIVILSPGFFEREWCMKELETFVRRGRVVPVYVGGFEAIQAAADAALAKRAVVEKLQAIRADRGRVSRPGAGLHEIHRGQVGGRGLVALLHPEGERRGAKACGEGGGGA